MNRIITFITFSLAAIAVSAQKADIEVSYVAHHPNMRDGKTDLTNQYILLANATESKFFSPVTEYIDSMKSTPDGAAKLREMTLAAFNAGKIDDIPRPDGSIYVRKSLADGKVTYYDNAGPEKFFYEEPSAQWDWAMGDSTKEILGYECMMATTDYHGRKWTVWFSPEIPVQNGPWKLDGLPGLILEAEAEGGQYSFVATGLQETTKSIGPVYSASEYERTNRMDFLKYNRSYMDNPDGKLNAIFGVSTDGTLKFVPAEVADFLETDYH